MNEPLHTLRFPGESDQYRVAREGLLRAEIELRRQWENVAARRRELPLGGEVKSDYAFEQWDAREGATKQVAMSDLFEAGKDTLFLYSFMIVPREQGLPYVGPCPSCTSIIDAIDGELPQITQRINFAVVAKAPVERFAEHGRSRGWRHARLFGTSGDYSRDYGAEDPNGYQWPLATVFRRQDGRIHHFWSSELFFAERDPGQDSRHVDFMWPMWLVFDHTPDGRGTDWGPQLRYD